MKALEDDFVKVFHGQKTFEYDLALVGTNRDAMLKALGTIHPIIAKNLTATVDAAIGDQAKAEALFRGMFERDEDNVQKGKFAQALAACIQDEGMEFVVPGFIRRAIEHACQP